MQTNFSPIHEQGIHAPKAKAVDALNARGEAQQLMNLLPAKHFLSSRMADDLTRAIAASGQGDIRDDKNAPGGPVLTRSGHLEIGLDLTYGRTTADITKDQRGGIHVQEQYRGVDPDVFFHAERGHEAAQQLAILQRQTFHAANMGMDPALYAEIKAGHIELRALSVAQQNMFSFTSLADGAGNAIGQVTPELMAFPQFSVTTTPFTNRQAIALPSATIIKTNDAYTEDTTDLFAVDDQLVRRTGIQNSVDYKARVEALNHGADPLQEAQQLALLALLLDYSEDFYESTYNASNETFRGIQEWLPSGQELAIMAAADGDDIDATTVKEVSRALDTLWGYKDGMVLGFTSTRTKQTMNHLAFTQGYHWTNEEGLRLFGATPDIWERKAYTRSSGIGIDETRGMTSTCSSFYWLAVGGGGVHTAVLAGHPMIRVVIGSKEASSADYVRVELMAAPLLRSRTAGVRLLGITN